MASVAKKKKVEVKDVGPYKGHRLGSRKGLVHEVFDGKGRDAAVAFGVEQGLKESTLTQWCRAWARNQA